MSPSRQWLGLAVFIGICFAAAGVGAMLTASSVNGWYATLHKPSWNPPNEVFGPFWTILYLCMGIAAWLMWRRQGLAGATIPLTIFAVQLTLNVAWSGLFFALHRIRLSLNRSRPWEQVLEDEIPTPLTIGMWLQLPAHMPFTSHHTLRDLQTLTEGIEWLEVNGISVSRVVAGNTAVSCKIYPL